MRTLFLLVLFFGKLATISAQNKVLMPISHRENIDKVILSPDGKYAVSADWNKCILWELSSGFSIAQYKRSHTNASDITFSAKSDKLIVCSGNSLNIYSVQTGAQLKNYGITSLVAAYFLDSANEVLIVTNDKLIRADIKEGKIFQKIDIGYRSLMNFDRLVLSKDKQYLFIDGKKGVSSINIYSGKETFYSNDCLSGVNSRSASFAENGNNLVAVACELGQTFIFDRETGFQKQQIGLPFNGHIDESGDTTYLPFQSRDHFYYGAENLEFLHSNQLMIHKKDSFEIWDLVHFKSIASGPSTYYKDHLVIDSISVLLVNKKGYAVYNSIEKKIMNQGNFAANIHYSNVVGDFGKLYQYNAANQQTLAIDTSTLFPILLNLRNNTVTKFNTKGISDLKNIILLPSTEGNKMYCSYEDFCVGWELTNARNLFGTSHVTEYGEYKAGTALGSKVYASPSKKWLVTEFNDYFNLFNFNTVSTCKIFSLPDHQFKHQLQLVDAFKMSDNDMMVYQLYDGKLKEIGILALATGNKTVISRDSLRAKVIDISRNGSYVAFLRNDHVYVYNTKTKKLFQGDKYSNWREDIDKIEFSPDEKSFIVLGFEAVEIPLYNSVTGKLIRTLAPAIEEDKGRMYQWAAFTSNSTSLFAKMSGNMYNFDLKTGTSKEFEFHNLPLNKTIDKEIWAVQDVGDTLLVCRLNNKDSIDIIRRIPLPGKSITINGDDLIFNNGKGATWYKITSADTLRFMAEVYSLDEQNSMFLTKPWYQADKKASESLKFLQKQKILSFEQLDLEYNRPDKVLQATGSKDSLRITSYKRAWQKRLQRLGIDTARFGTAYSVPVCSISNKTDLPLEQTSGSLKLTIQASDSNTFINRFNIWVNEVPVFTSKGIAITQNNRFDTTITIRLSSGDNRIETSVMNLQGIESFREPVFVRYVPTQPKTEKLYFIGIGINRFADSTQNLSWSVKDIRDLSARIKSKYPTAEIDTLFDADVTTKDIKSFKTKLQQLDVDDKVILAYSGHGLLSKDLDYYLSTFNVDFSKPETNGLAYNDLEQLLDSIAPRKKLVLIDACHSGEVDKEEIIKIEAAKKSLAKNGVNTKSNIKITPKKQLGMTSSFELMQNLFVNVSRGTGATIISAAGGMQYAQERGDIKNGVFTYSILTAFNQNSSLTISQLKKIVEASVVKLTNGLQRPTGRTGTNVYDWVVW